LKHHHESGPIKLSRRHQLWIYSISVSLVVSGVGWLVAHYFLAGAGEFGDAPHYSEPWWLKLHGALAMAFLVVFGALLPAHAFRAWRLNKNRYSGALMMSMAFILIISAYGLYYAGGDVLRDWLGLIHWITGLAAVAGLVLHIWMGKRNRTRVGHQLQHRHINQKHANHKRNG